MQISVLDITLCFNVRCFHNQNWLQPINHKPLVFAATRIEGFYFGVINMIVTVVARVLRGVWNKQDQEKFKALVGKHFDIDDGEDYPFNGYEFFVGCSSGIERDAVTEATVAELKKELLDVMNITVSENTLKVGGDVNVAVKISFDVEEDYVELGDGIDEDGAEEALVS